MTASLLSSLSLVSRSRGRARRRAVALVTATTFLLVSSVPAYAGDTAPTRMALIDVDGNMNPESTDIHYFVEKGVRTAGKPIELMPLDNVLNAGAQADDIQYVSLGREALTTGMRAFEAGDCDTATGELSQAVIYFERAFAFVEDMDDYVNALMHQAVCLARSGARPAAVQILVKALLFKPKLNFDGFTAEAALFTQAQESVRDRALTSLTVATVPDGSRIFVNGGYRGVSPTYRPGLRQGVHYVRVERQGYARVGMKVDTGEASGGDAKVEVTQSPARKRSVLQTLLPGLQTEFGLEEAGQNTARLQNLLLVDYVILMRATGPATAKQVELVLYNLVSGRRVNKVAATTNWGSRNRAAKNTIIELAGTLLDVELQAVVVVPDPNDPNRPPTTTAGGGVHTKWWFWTIIGAVVVGTAVGLAVGLQPEEPSHGLSQDGNGSVLIRF